MTRRLVTGILLAAAVGAAAAGCGSSKAGTGDATPKLTPVAQWAGRVCDVTGSKGSLAMPSLNPADPKAEKAGLITLLTGVSTRLKTQGDALRAQGAPPVDGGRAMLDKAVVNITGVRAAVDKVVAELQKAKTTDNKAFLASIRGLGATMAKFNSYQGPASDLAAEPALSAAFTEAPACKAAAATAQS